MHRTCRGTLAWWHMIWHEWIILAVLTVAGLLHHLFFSSLQKEREKKKEEKKKEKDADKGERLNNTKVQALHACDRVHVTWTTSIVKLKAKLGSAPTDDMNHSDFYHNSGSNQGLAFLKAEEIHEVQLKRISSSKRIFHLSPSRWTLNTSSQLNSVNTFFHSSTPLTPALSPLKCQKIWQVTEETLRNNIVIISNSQVKGSGPSENNTYSSSGSGPQSVCQWVTSWFT